jgi:ribosome-associated toxin RatA of RatAB toxin-antitoxin module
MSQLHVIFERFVTAPASVVYDCIADHRNHYPHFLPPQFKGFRVLRREGHSLYMAELDAIDQSPVFDIKPIMQEFCREHRSDSPHGLEN